MLKLRVPTQEPDEVDLNGMIDEEHNIKYLGEASRQQCVLYRVLAACPEGLCLVEVTARPLTEEEFREPT